MARRPEVLLGRPQERERGLAGAGVVDAGDRGAVGRGREGRGVVVRRPDAGELFSWGRRGWRRKVVCAGRSATRDGPARSGRVRACELVRSDPLPLGVGLGSGRTADVPTGCLRDRASAGACSGWTFFSLPPPLLTEIVRGS